MKNDFSLSFNGAQTAAAVKILNECNLISSKYGLALTKYQMTELEVGRYKALKDTDRFEFGDGIIKKLIAAFCDSAYLSSDNYFETLYELQEAFYYFKNESLDTISDDEMIEHMRTMFDGYAQGSVEYIAGTSLEELCRYARTGGDPFKNEDCEDEYLAEY